MLVARFCRNTSVKRGIDTRAHTIYVYIYDMYMYKETERPINIKCSLLPKDQIKMHLSTESVGHWYWIYTPVRHEICIRMLEVNII